MVQLKESERSCVNWTNACEQAWEMIKTKLVESPINIYTPKFKTTNFWKVVEATSKDEFDKAWSQTKTVKEIRREKTVIEPVMQ